MNHKENREVKRTKRIDLCIKTIKMMFPTAAGIGLLLGMTMIIFADISDTKSIFFYHYRN